MRQEFGTDQVIGSQRQPGTLYNSAAPISVGEVRNDAFSQLGRFRTVLERSQSATVEECRKDLETLRELKTEMPVTLGQFEQVAEVGDTTLVAAVRDTVGELGPLEDEVRRRLNWFTSGSPSNNVDLTALREEIAERAARRELGESFTTTTPPVLEIPMRNSSLAGIPMLIFGFGWLSFTTFHAILMIGGMSKAFGWGALFLLGFYSIFFMVGFGMLWGGISTFRKEKLILTGRSFTLRYTLFGHTWEKTHTLDKRSRAWVTTPLVQQKGNNAQEIAVMTGDGKEIRMGNGLPPPLLHEEAGRINDYLHSVFGSR